MAQCGDRQVGGDMGKRREVVNGARRIKSEKLRNYHYREWHVRSLERKREEGDGENNVEHIWEQVKRSKVESAREACD